MSNIVAKTEELVKPICEAAQVDLVDVEYVKEGQVFFLRVYVDTPEGIDIDQCATIAEAYAVNKKHFSFSMNFVSSYHIFFPFARKIPHLPNGGKSGIIFS